MACERCDDTGWKAETTNGVRRVVRCDCWREGVTARVLEEARIPPRYRACELDTFVIYPNEKLAAAATDVIAKVEAVIPERLREYMANTALLAPPHHYMEQITFDVAELRRALRSQLKLHFRYRDGFGDASERTVRPLCLAYFGPVWLLSAWCELRDDFRTFRLDRIDGFQVQADRFRAEPGKTLHDFLKRDQTWTRSRSPVAAVDT